MSRRGRPALEPGRNDIDAALAALSADELRDVIRAMLLELDEKDHASAMNSLIQRAARSGSGWAPAALSDDEVAEVLAFAKAAERVARADPSQVDEYLRRGSSAFLRKDYLAARTIFGALLPPIGDGEIDLGQHEMVDEVLGTDPDECAVQYVVSAYMISPPAERANAVRAAIEEVRGIGLFWDPIQEMERVAVEPLAGLAAFLPEWRALLEKKPAGARRSEWDTEEERWLREVVQRLEGSRGLAKIARLTRRADDLRAWCQSLVDAGDWKNALSAFAEAARLVADKDHARGGFLDGAALAAQELGRGDLSRWFERAWRAAASMLRLRRWLGSAGNKATLLKRAAEALEACPKAEARQRALLHVLQGAFAAAAKLLAAAPGLGWSHGDHPGHLLFPLFAGFLGGKAASPSSELFSDLGMDIDELESMTADDDKRRLASPAIDQILRAAGVDAIPITGVRDSLLVAMRKAAERRLAGVTDQKRRRHYGHAAELIAVCVECDPSPETAHWVESIRTEHRRFPAFRAELDRALS